MDGHRKYPQPVVKKGLAEKGKRGKHRRVETFVMHFMYDPEDPGMVHQPMQPVIVRFIGEDKEDAAGEEIPQGQKLKIVINPGPTLLVGVQAAGSHSGENDGGHQCPADLSSYLFAFF